MYVNSSYFEGFPNSVVEAINFGLPIISSQSYGGINEILLNGKCGTIFKNGDSVDLANKIQNFYNNPKKFFLKTKLAKRNIKRFTLKKISVLFLFTSLRCGWNCLRLSLSFYWKYYVILIPLKRNLRQLLDEKM